MTLDESVREQLIDLLGNEAYLSDGSLNRKFIAEKIFSDSGLKSAVEEIVHPATLLYIEREFAKSNPGEIVGMESAILFQTGLDEIFDAIILVDAPDELIVKRQISGGKFSEEDVRRRMAEQGYENAMAEDAEFVVKNDGTLESLETRGKIVLELVKIAAMQELPIEPLRSLEPS